ncbi:Peptidylprolyl isomerase [Planctomycetales bacterium 10988]|nr:Peptidylprolyl isomerase [Planctomycetales bacterium 10988]
MEMVRRQHRGQGLLIPLLLMLALVSITSAQQPQPQAEPPQGPNQAMVDELGPKVVAKVNNQRIMREELAQESMRMHGKTVLQNLVNRKLIEIRCKDLGITISDQEVQEEITKIAQRFGLPRDQWLIMLQQERDVTPREYARDIIWPTLALRKLASNDLKVTPEELQFAYETQYGPAVQCRMIVTSKKEDADEARKRALAAPEQFGRLAIEISEDTASASAGGMVQPIRLHVGDKGIEHAAFTLQPGQISEVIQVAGQFVVLKCERHYPPRPVPLENVKELLSEQIKEKKLSQAGQTIFADIQNNARIINVFNNPALRQEHPEVAAFVNNQPVMLSHLSSTCMLRHGKEVLDGMINRMLLAQELAKAQIEITPQDLNQEVANMAEKMGYQDPRLWVEEILKERDINYDFFLQQTVWPSVGLRKLVEKQVIVQPEDLQKGFEANYGPRVRMLALFFNNPRRAQEVWGMISREPTEENVRALAEQHSEDPQTRALGGEVPPLHRHCGNPQLEKEAFALSDVNEAGQPDPLRRLSPVVQIGPQYVILYFLGKTRPVEVSLEEVKDILHQEIFDKKLNLAMSEQFDHIRSQATIDNLLAGTVQSPDVEKPAPGDRVTEKAPQGPTR